MGLRMYQAPQLGGAQDTDDFRDSFNDTGQPSSNDAFSIALTGLSDDFSSANPQARQRAQTALQRMATALATQFETENTRVGEMQRAFAQNPEGDISSDMIVDASRNLVAISGQARQLQEAVLKTDPSALARAAVLIRDPRQGHEGEAMGVRIGTTFIPTGNMRVPVGSPELQTMTPADAQTLYRMEQGWQASSDLSRQGFEQNVSLQQGRNEEAARERAHDAAVKAAANQVAQTRATVDENNSIRAMLVEQGKLTQREAELAWDRDKTGIENTEKRLQLAVSTLNTQETNAFKGWAESQNFRKDVWETINGMIKSKNERESAEDITRVTALSTQRGNDVAASRDIALAAKDIYLESVKNLFYAPQAWVDAMQKGFSLIAAGKTLPKDWMQGVPMPVGAPPDTALPRREFAAMMGTTPEKPLPERYDLATMLRPRQEATPAPAFVAPPGHYVSPELQQALLPSGTAPASSLTARQQAQAGLADGTTGEPFGTEPDQAQPDALQFDTGEDAVPLYQSFPGGDETPESPYQGLEPDQGGEEMLVTPMAPQEPDENTAQALQMLEPVGLIASRYIGQEQSAARAGATLADIQAGDDPAEAWNNNWGDLGEEYAWQQPEDLFQWDEEQDQDREDDVLFGDLFDV